MIAALERFENDYNLADGTDYRRSTMSAEAWAMRRAFRGLSVIPAFRMLPTAILRRRGMKKYAMSPTRFARKQAILAGVCSTSHTPIRAKKYSTDSKIRVFPPQSVGASLFSTSFATNRV